LERTAPDGVDDLLGPCAFQHGVNIKREAGREVHGSGLVE
jgi:hypothetical protein